MYFFLFFVVIFSSEETINISSSDKGENNDRSDELATVIRFCVNLCFGANERQTSHYTQ